MEHANGTSNAICRNRGGRNHLYFLGFYWRTEARRLYVALQPGRPVFYGRRGATHFFGLPGNPVASAVCFKVLVEPLLRRLAGHREPYQQTVQATFEGTFKRTDDRARYVGVELIESNGRWTARGVPTHGPADLSALARSTGLAVLAPNQGPFEGGEDVEVLLIHDRV